MMVILNKINKLVVASVFFGLFVSATNVISQEKRQKRKLKQRRAVAERVTPESIPRTAFVDAHVHLNDIKMQLELMKKYKIPQAIVFWGRNSTNESLIKAARDYPDKFIPFVSVSPEREKYRSFWKRNDLKLLATLEKQLKTEKFKGIGEISITHFPGFGFPEADFSPTSSLMKGIMKLAEKYKVPINIHCEITRLKEFSALLSEFKNVKVIWAHGGYTPYFLAKRILENHPNLYYELSARTWLNHPRSSDYTIFKSNSEVWKQWKDLVEENPTRFIVGSDVSHHSHTGDETKVKSVQLFLNQLSPKTKSQVAKKNILALVQ